MYLLKSKQDHSQDEHEGFINFDHSPQARTLDIVDSLMKYFENLIIFYCIDVIGQ